MFVFVPSVVIIFLGTTGILDIPVPTAATALRSEAARDIELPLVRNLFHDGSYRVELWDGQADQWQSVFESKRYVMSARLSPNGMLLATLTDQQRLQVLDISDGTQILDRLIDEVPLQNGLIWIDDRSILIAGASNMRARSMARFDVELNASDGVVCWDTVDMTPRWTLVDVGEEETVTFSPAGQIISATAGATDQLVWIVDNGSGIELKTVDEFAELTQNVK